MGFFDDLLKSVSKSVSSATSAAKKSTNVMPASAYSSGYRSSTPAPKATTNVMPASAYSSGYRSSSPAPKTINDDYRTSRVTAPAIDDDYRTSRFTVGSPNYNAAVASSGGGGGSSGGGGGGGGGGTGGGLPGTTSRKIIPPKPVAPALPEVAKVGVVTPSEVWDSITVPDAMADADYQRDITGLNAALRNFGRQQTSEKQAKVKTYGKTLEDLGWNVTGKGKDLKDDLDDTGEWQQRGGKGSFANSFLANENDFGSRGLSDSGIYQDAVANMISDYDRRRTEMVDERQDWQQAQNEKSKQFKDTDQSSRLDAKSEAIAKLAKQYGIEDSMVGWDVGKEGKTFKRRTDSGAEKDKANKWVVSDNTADELNKKAKATAEAAAKARANTTTQANKKKYSTKKSAYDKELAAWEKQYG